VRNPDANVPPKANGKLDVRGAIGNGWSMSYAKQPLILALDLIPYIGSCPIVSGEIAEDFCPLFNTAEQGPLQ